MDKYKPVQKEISPCGKFIYTYHTVSDLQGNLLSTYWMNQFGRKNGFFDQYKIFKYEQIIKSEPFKFSNMIEYVECLKKLYGTLGFVKGVILNSQNNKIKKLGDYEKQFDVCAEIPKDLG